MLPYWREELPIARTMWLIEEAWLALEIVKQRHPGVDEARVLQMLLRNGARLFSSYLQGFTIKLENGGKWATGSLNFPQPVGERVMPGDRPVIRSVTARVSVIDTHNLAEQAVMSGWDENSVAGILIQVGSMAELAYLRGATAVAERHGHRRRSIPFWPLP